MPPAPSPQQRLHRRQRHSGLRYDRGVQHWWVTCLGLCHSTGKGWVAGSRPRRSAESCRRRRVERHDAVLAQPDHHPGRFMAGEVVPHQAHAQEHALALARQDAPTPRGRARSTPRARPANPRQAQPSIARRSKSRGTAPRIRRPLPQPSSCFHSALRIGQPAEHRPIRCRHPPGIDAAALEEEGCSRGLGWRRSGQWQAHDHLPGRIRQAEFGRPATANADAELARHPPDRRHRHKP